MEFFGSDLTRNELELKGLLIDPGHRSDLPDLMRSRWFEYWALHPVAATYLFASLYREQVREFAECFVDIDTAEAAKAFTPDDIFKSRDMTSMWLARSAADRVGAPYGVMLAFAQKRALDRTFQRFPRPNQLYGEEFELDLADHWKAMKGYSLQYCRGEHFAASRYPGPKETWPPEVAAHADYLAARVADRPAPRHKMLGRMFREDRLSPTWQLPFTDAEIAAAVQHANDFGVSNR